MFIFEFIVYFECGDTKADKSFFVLANDIAYAKTTMAAKLKNSFEDVDHFELKNRHEAII